jgi:UDP-N-acetylglucosamine diphosphorylase/glucosamine-1-phosphate N-acetyltransferase
MHTTKPPSVLCVFEDDRYPNFLPLSLARPVFDLAIGTHTLKNRLVDEIDPRAIAILCRPYLAAVFAADEARLGGRPCTVNAPQTEEDILFLNGRILAYGSELRDLVARAAKDTLLRKKGTIVGARLSGERALALADHIGAMISDGSVERAVNEIKRAASSDAADKPRSGDEHDAARGRSLAKWAAQNGVKLEEANVRLVSHYWQLIGENRTCIGDDFQKSPLRGTAPETELFKGVELINENDIVIGADVEVRSGTVLDASEGAIVIANGVRIEPNAIIYGPCAIGEGAIVRGGAKIGHGTTIGRQCRVGGEIEESIFSPFGNKQHDGFVGHSCAGSWVNIGAGSCTSDLKNNYGLVRAWTAGRMRDTGRRFLGATIGDHAKVAVNSRLNTGAVVGFNANVLSSGFPPKFVPSFTWQIEPEFVRCGLDDAIETARTMMDRRSVPFTEAHEELFKTLFRLCRLGGGTL